MNFFEESVPITSLPLFHAIGITQSELFSSFSFYHRAFKSADFRTEIEIILRLRYKNSNQHRGAIYFRKLALICTLLKRLDAIGIASSLSDLLDVMESKRFLFY